MSEETEIKAKIIFPCFTKDELGETHLDRGQMAVTYNEAGEPKLVIGTGEDKTEEEGK